MLALLLATACASPAASVPTATPTAAATVVPPTASPSPAAATATSAPTGTPYHVNVPESMWGAWQASISGSTSVSNGLWSMEIIENEFLVLNPRASPGESFPLGVTDITADHVTFYADQECQAGALVEGTYTYALVADQLTFTLIQDNCRDRRALLTAVPWVRP